MKHVNGVTLALIRLLVCTLKLRKSAQWGIKDHGNKET